MDVKMQRKHPEETGSRWFPEKKKRREEERRGNARWMGEGNRREGIGRKSE